MMTKMTFKLPVLTAAIFFGGVAAIAQVQAQPAAYPTQNVTMIASAAPGGTTDLAARMIAEPLSKALGRAVVVENRPGGSGAIAASAVKRAEPDGHTLLVQYSGFHVITPNIQKVGFDPLKDFAPVANLLIAPQVIVIRAGLPVKSLPELIAYAKANPGMLTYASSGNGSLQHVTGEQLRMVAGVDLVHVPYKGTGPALNDLLGGTVDITFTTAPPLLGHIKAGKIRALAVTGKTRLASLPDVKATAEMPGLEKLDASSWFAVYAPAATPRPVVDRLAAEIGKIMKTDEFKAKAEEQGANAVYMNPAQLGDFTKSELQSWGRFVKAGNIKAD